MKNHGEKLRFPIVDVAIVVCSSSKFAGKVAVVSDGVVRLAVGGKGFLADVTVSRTLEGSAVICFEDHFLRKLEFLIDGSYVFLQGAHEDLGYVFFFGLFGVPRRLGVYRVVKTLDVITEPRRFMLLIFRRVLRGCWLAGLNRFCEALKIRVHNKWDAL